MTTACSTVAALMATVLVASTLFGAATGQCDVQKDLSIWQSLGEPQRDDSSEYRVDVTNRCIGDERSGRPCAISRILLRCGNFRSLIPINPTVFRNVSSGVCLLNDGHSIPQGSNVSFVYTNYQRNELYVYSAMCTTA
ncbi:unnamed protein product [Alopecurus aequalis]